MKYRTIGTDPNTRRDVSVVSLGTMHFGTATDEATSFAILDRYVEAGGTFIDTADNYAFWFNGGQGGESEELLGRWRRSRGVGEEIVIATKLGGRPLSPGTSFVDNPEGLSAPVIRESAQRSRDRLGMPRLDLLYAHIDDPAVPVAEAVKAFADLVADGTVGLLGVSNHWAWQVERARNLAAAAGLPGYEMLQYQYSYLRPRTDLPGQRSPDGMQGMLGGDLLSYLRADPEFTAVAYSPLLKGGYVRQDKLNGAELPAAADDALRLLLRAFGVAEEQIPGDLPGRASVYRSLLRDRRALVVLDNAGSEEQVRPLLPGDGASRALITAKRLLAGLEGVRRLALGPLSLPEATELLTGILGQRAASDEESALSQLAVLCEGMPLALRIIGNRLVSRPGWDAAELAARLADEEHRLDQFKVGDLKIATAFGMSYDQLSGGSRRVFRRLAVVPGRDFDADLAAVVGEVPIEVAWDALDELVDLGLLHDSAAGRYRFHDLVRLFARTRLEEEESPADREALTARVARVARVYEAIGEPRRAPADTPR